MMFLTKATQHNDKRFFIMVQHRKFFYVIIIKISVFLSNLLSIENDLSTAAEVGWDFAIVPSLLGQ